MGVGEELYSAMLYHWMMVSKETENPIQGASMTDSEISMESVRLKGFRSFLEFLRIEVES